MALAAGSDLMRKACAEAMGMSEREGPSGASDNTASSRPSVTPATSTRSRKMRRRGEFALLLIGSRISNAPAQSPCWCCFQDIIAHPVLEVIRMRASLLSPTSVEFARRLLHRLLHTGLSPRKPEATCAANDQADHAE